MTDKQKLLNVIETQMNNLYPLKKFGKSEAHVSDNGSIFRVFAFPGEDALCIEYAENEKQAMGDIFPEDGDRFYLDEYPSAEEMLKSMIHEIES
ncbi:MAG: hypothetical protein LUF92_17195 [Clostridiales bacterium]|nr:hypothetical protein [Clostridiales bacterium]